MLYVEDGMDRHWVWSAERHDREPSTCSCIRRDDREELDGSRDINNDTRVTGVIIHFNETSCILGVDGHAITHFGRDKEYFPQFLDFVNVTESWWGGLLIGSFPLNSWVCIMSITVLSVAGTNDIFYAMARLMRQDIGMGFGVLWKRYHVNRLT